MIDLDVLEMDKETLAMLHALYNKIKSSIEEKLHKMLDSESGYIDSAIITIFNNWQYSADVECKFIPNINAEPINTKIDLREVDILKRICEKKENITK